MEVVISEEALRYEFAALISDVFEPQFILYELTLPAPVIEWKLIKNYKRTMRIRFYEYFNKPKVENAVLIQPDRRDTPTNGFCYLNPRRKIFADGEYRRIEINVLIPEAMDKAKSFAQKYEDISGKSAIILQQYMHRIPSTSSRLH